MLKKVIIPIATIFGVVSAFASDGAAKLAGEELSARDAAIGNVSDDSMLYFSDAVSEVSSYRPGHWSHRSHASHASHASHRSGYRY